MSEREQETASRKATGRERLEYAALRTLVAVLGTLPRGLSRKAGAAVGGLAWSIAGRLRRVGLRNLQIAFPDWSEAKRIEVLRTLYRTLGWQMAEFCRMRRADRAEAEPFFRYEGLEHYLAAKAKGNGVFVLTGHLGAWELSSFYHSLLGYPMTMVIRRLDNPLVDAFVNGVRCMHGNRVVHKNDFARGLLQAMHCGETVGILMDTNMTPPQGLFVPYFGVEACTASGLARVALRTEAAVLPGFMLWEQREQRYVLHFGPELELVRSGDAQADVAANTALFTKTLEEWVRRYPEQWLWVHRRWKTRPVGEGSLY